MKKKNKSYYKFKILNINAHIDYHNTKTRDGLVSPYNKILFLELKSVKIVVIIFGKREKTIFLSRLYQKFNFRFRLKGSKMTLFHSADSKLV